MVILKVNNVCLRKIRSLHNSNTLYTVFTTNFYETDVIFWESHFFFKSLNSIFLAYSEYMNFSTK